MNDTPAFSSTTPVAHDQPKPICCPRRGVECDTPNACAGGVDCRFGPDLNTRMNDRPSVSNTTAMARMLSR
jgi:hypothetical protein